MISQLGIQLGRIFEIGFNLGILTYFKQRQFKQSYQDIYVAPLSQIYLYKISEKLANENHYFDRSDRQTILTWVKLFLQKGWTSGVTFIREYREATGWKDDREIEILYFQCDFYNDNCFNLIEKNENTAYREVLETQGFNNVDIIHYKDTGEFLKADTLLLTRYRDQYRILVVDLSTFTTSAVYSIQDIKNIDTLKKLLKQELNYIRSKSQFCGLEIDTGETNNYQVFSQKLEQYFSAFSTKDKEAVKVIQAGSYAWSFYDFLLKNCYLKSSDSVKFNCFGYSDRLINGISLNSESSLKILKTCYEIYRHKVKINISENRKRVLNVIKSNASKSFKNGSELVNSIIEAKPNQITSITHQEVLKVRESDFFNTADNIPETLQRSLHLTQNNLSLRDAHAELIQRSLSDPQIPYLFLTGNPGIGKTTAIANYILHHLETGTLLFYVSPRIQVNRDIIEKFCDPVTHQLNNNIICLNTNAMILNDQKGGCAVESYYHRFSEDVQIGKVKFLNASLERDYQLKSSQRFGRNSEEVLEVKPRNQAGVLASLSEAIHTCLIHPDQFPNNIIATASIQALKETRSGNTLKHLKRIFSSVYNSSTRRVIPEKVKLLSQRLRNIFIMIDEITGSPEGVAFLHGIKTFIEEYDLLNPDYGFNIKVITADASLTLKDVVESHLSDQNVQADKIFVRQVSPTQQQCLWVDQFKFLNQYPATLINANSYPASQLTIDYQVLIHSVSDQENNEDDLTLINQMIDIIKSDILQRLNQNQGQIIVYIQNKDKLKKLIDLIAKQLPNFEAEKDYLEIHASLSEKEIANIQQFKDSVNVIFMTASASRGLSFPNTRYILVEIPGFQIEQNLMEIIQVIYRGRGGSLDQGEKFIKFYLSDKAIYFTPKVDQDNHPLSPAESQELAKIYLQESCLSALNILIILKASIMTRIVGSGQIGFQSYVMIPIGGKSIKQGGDSFLGSMVTLYQEVQKESKKHRQDQHLKEISQRLLNLLSAQKIEIYRPPVTSKTQQEVSYLSLGWEILSKLEKSLDQFLDLPPLEKTYVRGSLLIIPLSEKTVREINYIDLSRIFALENSDFFKQLWGLAKGNYPKQIKTLVASALELVYTLVEVKERSQQVIQTSKSCDRYYAFPIQTFLTFSELEEYFLSDRKLLPPSFQDILRRLVYALASADNILPVDGNYRNLPYVVFNTNSMDKLGKNLFNENQLFHSKEMNILNLILSQSD
ncbi:Helicase-like protein [Planktothrix sp. PCC 11201]|uniref:helicase-related protein n=1 Tax=Planktothrix sp. PCC 11201 TaxID=1729650 RepID=UPI0009125FE5|nr:helicase-related protein [Planktothrix sp. PCC 11201]SKB16016.1 Helicase-like protein [Planktothrix sp. PCC 11201]